MQPVLTTGQMNRADRDTVTLLHTDEIRLMELAGREAARIIGDLFSEEGNPLDSRSFLVVCGKGNNGGDGFVLARHLVNLGAAVDIVLTGPSDALSSLNRGGLSILEAYAAHTERLRIFKSLEEAHPHVTESSYDGLVDSLLGTGFRLEKEGEPLKNPVRSAVELINSIRERSAAILIALDVPSGLDATTGFSATPSIHADVTVCMAYLKTGFFFHSGPRQCGDIHVAEISIPEFILQDISCHLTDLDYAAEHFHLRDPGGAKHTNGKLLVIAGSVNEHSSMLGAALLTTKAAVKTGAGYVCTSMPTDFAAPLHTLVPSATVIGRDRDTLLEKAAWADAIVIGCGLGRDSDTIDLFRDLLTDPLVASKKLILDADALFALTCGGFALDALDFRDILLTPHAGEFSRMTGLTLDEILASPLERVREYAARHHVNVLLKGGPTCLADPSGNVLINNTGTEALSTAGSGDVLSGMIAALAAKGTDTFNAGGAGAWLHGRAGDLSKDISSLVSSEDILNAIPEAVSEIFHIEEG